MLGTCIGALCKPFRSRKGEAISLYFLSSVVPHFLQTRTWVALLDMPDAHRPAGRADQLHVRDRNPALLLRDAALHVALRVGTHMLLRRSSRVDQNFRVTGKHVQDTAFFSLSCPP